MLDSPEFEPEFYAAQIVKMEERYSKLFKKWKLNWETYYEYVSSKLKYKQYWVWVYLCGFEKFVQEQGDQDKGRHKSLYKDADERIRRIVGDYFKIEEYVRHL